MDSLRGKVYPRGSSIRTSFRLSFKSFYFTTKSTIPGTGRKGGPKVLFFLPSQTIDAMNPTRHRKERTG